MKKIGAFEAKTQFARLVREASAGEIFVITRNGEPVAQISPLPAVSGLSAEAAAQRLRSRKARLGISIGKALSEGRR